MKACSKTECCIFTTYAGIVKWDLYFSSPTKNLMFLSMTKSRARGFLDGIPCKWFHIFVLGAKWHLTRLPANRQHWGRDNVPSLLPRLQRGWTGPTDRKIRRKFAHYIIVLRSRQLVYHCRKSPSLDYLTCSICTMYILLLYLLFIIMDIPGKLI